MVLKNCFDCFAYYVMILNAYLAASSKTFVLSVKDKRFLFFFSACYKYEHNQKKNQLKAFCSLTSATKCIKFIFGLFALMSVIFCKEVSLTPAAFPA